MRFRIRRKKKNKNKISVIQKIKSINYIRKELKNVGNKTNAYKRIAIFYDEYNKIQPIMKEKLKESKELNHIGNYNRLLSFDNDLNSLKKMLDRIMLDVNDENLDKSIKKRILNTKVGTLALAFKLMGTMSGKYRKENCDIDNFMV